MTGEMNQQTQSTVNQNQAAMMPPPVVETQSQTQVEEPLVVEPNNVPVESLDDQEEVRERTPYLFHAFLWVPSLHSSSKEFPIGAIVVTGENKTELQSKINEFGEDVEILKIVKGYEKKFQKIVQLKLM